MNRDLRLISISLVLWGFGEGMFFYFQPLYLEKLGAEPVQIGVIMGAIAAAMTFSYLPAGALADKFGTRKLILAGYGVGVVGVWMMFLARELTFFSLASVLYYASIFVVVPMSSYATSARTDWTVERTLTTVYAFFNLGQVPGAFAGGQIAETFGLRTVYGVAGTVIIAATIIVFFIRSHPIAPAPVGPRYKALLSNGALGRLMVLVAVSMVGLYLSWPLTPNFLQGVRGVRVSEIGLFGSLNSLGAVLLNLLLGRFAAHSAFFIAQGLVAGSVAALWLGTGLPWYALGYFIAGATRTSHSLLVALTERLVRQSELGLAYAVTETLAGLGLVIAAPIAGILYRKSPVLPFPASLVLIGGSIVLTVFLAPRSKQMPDPAAVPIR